MRNIFRIHDQIFFKQSGMIRLNFFFIKINLSGFFVCNGKFCSFFRKPLYQKFSGSSVKYGTADRTGNQKLRSFTVNAKCIGVSDRIFMAVDSRNFQGMSALCQIFQCNLCMIVIRYFSQTAR